MKNEKANEQFIDQLAELRQRIAELEALEVQHKQAEETLRESESTRVVNWRRRRDSTANMFSAIDGLRARRSTNDFLGRKQTREFSSATACAGRELRPSNTGTSPNGSPGPKIWRICSFPSGESLKIFTRPERTR